MPIIPDFPAPQNILFDRELSFTPEPDITAYELAQIVSCMGHCEISPLVGVVFHEKTWRELSPSIKRHFKDI